MAPDLRTLDLHVFLGVMLKLFLFSLLVLGAAALSAPTVQGRAPRSCSKRCVARDCGSLTLSYGKYCGVTHTGCEGEEPCDAFDACCAAHDKCVGTKTMGLGKQDKVCHSAFTACLRKAEEAGAAPFTSKPDCDIKKVVKTMIDGISLASSFAGLFSEAGKVEMPVTWEGNAA